MKSFVNAIAEVRNTLNRLIFFDTAINAILFFVLALFVLSLFGLHFIFPAAASLAYFGWMLRKRLKVSKVRVVEQKYQQLNEKLRTAAENQSEDNPVVKELHDEVLHDLKGVEEAAFVDQRKIYVKSIAIVFLSFLVLFLSPHTVGLLDFAADAPEEPELGDSPLSTDSGASRLKFAGKEETGLLKAGGEIFGTPAVAMLGDEELKIKIRPAGSELNIREIQEADLPDFYESYPADVQAVAAASFEEEIPKEDLELVRNYFNELAK
ncbi:hypothetical protein HYX10_06380 [Candidatus Woesearchaeota archaeon]|nr:hypothetical protein [Candidatus Woesearchaeota archaeon]